MPINFSTYTAVFWWRPACWLRVAGADAATFLQGQFTNDLRLLERERAVYGLWLNVKGKVIADSFVLRGAEKEEFWIGSYFSTADAIHERLESHIIADDVTITDATAEWVGVTCWPGEATHPTQDALSCGFLFRGRRSSMEHLEWVFPKENTDAARALLAGPPEITQDEVARRRIAAGIPAVPLDLGPGDLPNEGGLEAAAISYTKGCYLGQEVMARLKSMGQIRRRLLRVRGSGTLVPATPTPLFAGARQVGELRSVAPDGEGGWIGLAMVSLLHVHQQRELSFAADAAVALTLVDSP